MVMKMVGIVDVCAIILTVIAVLWSVGVVPT
jgi:hypothetical protein